MIISDEIINKWEKIQAHPAYKILGVTDSMTPIETLLNLQSWVRWEKFELHHKVLLPACGQGILADLVLEILMILFEKKIQNPLERRQHIIKHNIYLNEIHPGWIRFLKKDGFQNIHQGDFLDYQTIMKFDAIIVNPPYKNSLHIKMFNKCFDLLSEDGDLVCIHPSTPFVNRKPTKDNGETIRIKQIITEYKSTLKLVDGNKIFENAGFFVPLSITHVKKIKDSTINVIYSHTNESKTEPVQYQDLNYIYLHGNDIVLDIKKKIESKMTSSLEDNMYRNGKKSDTYYALNRYSGNTPKKEHKNINPDFFQLTFKKNEKDYKKLITRPREKSEQGGGNQFNDLAIQEPNVENLHNYLLTKFARFTLSIYKIAATLDCKELCLVPYMDFSREWTDQQLFDHFELTQEEQNFILNYIPNWYERDFE